MAGSSPASASSPSWRRISGCATSTDPRVEACRWPTSSVTPPSASGLPTSRPGQQIASGRFGVTSELLNSPYLLEIKIGQGAKPGEGGHLPGSKVTDRVALARNAQAGIDLISPSNNHDLYSIEDLAQLIEELKTGNPDARLAVKLPAVPGLATFPVAVSTPGPDTGTLPA